MVSIYEACKILLKKTGKKYVSGISDYKNTYVIGTFDHIDEDVIEGFALAVEKETGKITTIGSGELFWNENEIKSLVVPKEFRCPDYEYYRDYPE